MVHGFNGKCLRNLSVLALACLFLYAAPAEARNRRHAARYAPSGTSYGCHPSPYGSAGNLPPHAIFNGGVDRRVNPGLVKDAQIVGSTASLRAYNGGQVVITSGFRDCFRNATTPGSAKHSAHLRGHAVDIRSHMASPFSYAKAIQSKLVSQGALSTAVGGFYNSCVRHVHLDTEHRNGFTDECGGKGRFRRANGGRYRRHR